jgi:hypothetical protein
MLAGLSSYVRKSEVLWLEDTAPECSGGTLIPTTGTSVSTTASHSQLQLPAPLSPAFCTSLVKDVSRAVVMLVGGASPPASVVSPNRSDTRAGPSLQYTAVQAAGVTYVTSGESNTGHRLHESPGWYGTPVGCTDVISSDWKNHRHNSADTAKVCPAAQA